MIRAGGYDAPTSEQSSEMGRVTTAAILGIVVGLRSEGPAPEEHELIETTDAIAEGSILRVLGSPPAAKTNAN